MHHRIFCSVKEPLAGYVDWKSGLALGGALCGLNAYIVSGKIDGVAVKTNGKLDSLGKEVKDQTGNIMTEVVCLLAVGLKILQPRLMESLIPWAQELRPTARRQTTSVMMFPVWSFTSLPRESSSPLVLAAKF